jgi:HK97 family phage major capsid protein
MQQARNNPDLDRRYATARAKLSDIEDSIRSTRAKAARENRSLSRRERAEVETLESLLPELTRAVESAFRQGAFDPRLVQNDNGSWWSPGGGGSPSNGNANPQILAPDQSVADYMREHRPEEYRSRMGGAAYELASEPGRASLGRFVRGLVTGDWHGAEEERALVEGTGSAGGFLTPEPLASTFIDRVRAATRVISAGATTVPLTSDIENFPRLTGGASPSWKAEMAPISASDLTFDRLTFTPKTLPVLIQLSRELFEDMSAASAAGIEHEMAQALSLELDRAALRADGSANSPLGILHQSGVPTTTVSPPNGAAITWDFLIDGVSVIRNSSVDPSGVIMAPRSLQSLQKAKDSQGRYLATPAPFNTSASDAISVYTSAQVPTNLSVGTSSDCSEAYCGRWSDCWLGIRTDMRLNVRVLEERYADTLSVALLAYLRADIQLAHASSFNVVLGLRP